MTIESARKLEIFVGATRHDLAEARQAIINAILMKGHIPSGMEFWSAGPNPPPHVIAGHLQRCDVHILLLGARYGSPTDDTDDGISYTEWEYLQSEDNRPILAFLFDEESLEQARKKEKDPREKRNEIRAKLDRLRSRLRRCKYVKEFRNNDKGLGELEREAILAIDELLRSYSIPESAGWIRGDSNEARAAQEISNNPFLKRELEQLQRFSTLSSRVELDVGSKKALAKTFWWHMRGRIRRHGYTKLFFESGSTVAYLADEFVNPLLQQGQDTEGWHIRTNNVLSLVNFDLHTPIDAARFPAGIPDPNDEYGAIFPRKWKELHEPPPVSPRRLHAKERKAVEEMRREFNTNGPHLVLAAASGFDLHNRIKDFQGPHVGSHPNMLFKRSIFTSNCPVVLFISAEKLGDPFRLRICYPVFSPDDPWREAIRKYPLAICVGFESPKESKTAQRFSSAVIKSRNNLSYILKSLHGLGLKVDYFIEKSPSTDNRRRLETGAVMCSNDKFAALIRKD